MSLLRYLGGFLAQNWRVRKNKPKKWFFAQKPPFCGKNRIFSKKPNPLV